MAHYEGTGKGEAAGVAGTPQWLVDLKAGSAGMRRRRERPAGRSFGRWLGDFLDQDTPSGLLPAEEKLLFAAANGEACVIQSRAARLWTEFESWRKRHSTREAPDVHSDAGFAEALTKFLAGAPESVQEVVHEATMRAVAGIGLPADWEPKNAEETAKLALFQHEYFRQLEAEAYPARTAATGRTSESFFMLAAEAVSHAFAAPPPDSVKLQDKWFAQLLRNDPLNLPRETRARIEEQPRVMQGFFGELIVHLRRVPVADEAWAARLKTEPAALRPHFDAVFARFEREAWRWVDPEDPEAEVRAGFLRFLAQGGDDAAPVHERRLELHGAYVAGDLDLSGCTIPQPLLFDRCYFGGSILLKDAASRSLNFHGSHVSSIDADSANIRGVLFLHNGFCSEGGVSLTNALVEGRLWCKGGRFLSAGRFAINCVASRFSEDVLLNEEFVGEGGVFFKGAKIGGDLNCAGGTFRNRAGNGTGVALDCANAEISGSAVLANGFLAEGMVSFPEAKIGGTLNCRKGTFANHTGDGKSKALSFEHAQIEDGVYLRDGFLAEGEVRFNAARIKANFECTGGRFNNPVSLDAGSKVVWNNALSLVRATVEGVLWLGPQAGDPRTKADFVGSVNLAGCHAHEFVDHPSSWPHKGAGNATHTYIHLNGFTYGRMVGQDAYDADTRKRWLDRQPPADRGGGFKPQPYEQLIQVYRAMGHDERARETGKLKAQRWRRANFINLWHGWRAMPRFWQGISGSNPFSSALNGFSWPFALLARVFARAVWSVVLALEWIVVGFGAAYGYGYFRLGAFLLALWFLGGIIYGGAAGQGGFAPSSPSIYLNKELAEKCGQNWTECHNGPPELPSFSPFIYSLDLMLPGLDLGQKHEWQPVSRPARRVEMGLPKLTSKPEGDPEYTMAPQLSFERETLGEGALGDIVAAQTLLSWVALGLLIAILSGAIKKD
jgi:hypothetical protein